MDICTGKQVVLFRFIGYILAIIKILIPILLILIGSIDIIKSMISLNKESLNKNIILFTKRLIAAVVIFFIPLIINFFMIKITQIDSSCLNCVLDVNTCKVNETSKISNTVCSKFTNEKDCNKNNICEWESISGFNINVNSNNGKYCINKFFVK